MLREEGLVCSRVGVYSFIVHSRNHGIMRKPGSGRPTKMCHEVKSFVERTMQQNDETTAHQLFNLLECEGISISLATILRCRTSLGWTFRGSAYCQLIRDANKELRYNWALQFVNDEFNDMIYTDETSIQMEAHKRFCCRKQGQAPKPKPKPKHPLKVHVWAGISRSGATGICIFEGIMDRHLYIKILDQTLKPFIKKAYPNGHRLMADNDPKHTSLDARAWLVDNGINWFRTPAESPDMNPIENLWHELKEFIRREVKPRTKDELVEGIKLFWTKVDVAKCNKYINHLKKVIPKVIELKGMATGY